MSEALDRMSRVSAKFRAEGQPVGTAVLRDCGGMFVCAVRLRSWSKRGADLLGALVVGEPRGSRFNQGSIEHLERGRAF